MPNLVGTGLNQVPTNGMLGGLAYQSPDHASIKDLDLKNLSQINSEIADTAVDIFVYDTRKDSDGGAWRKRTQHTSWYNETLNTATRGSRKEFPAVAILVLEYKKLTIYDGDDPDFPMWMVFNTVDTLYYLLGGANDNDFTSITAINGNIIVGNYFSYNHGGIVKINFIKDDAFSIVHNQDKLWIGGILNRNSDQYWQTINSSNYLRSNSCNDLAVTILPNAPIDPATGLPIPTIAVATNGGVSVIKDDGSVVDIYSGNINYTVCKKISFTDDNKIAYTLDGGSSRRSFRVDSIPESDIAITTDQLVKGNGEEFYVTADFGLNATGSDLAYSNQSNSVAYQLLNRNVAHSKGLSLIQKDGPARHAFITTSYNTGWMPGKIKHAWLSSTDTSSFTGTQYSPNVTFDSTDVSGFTQANYCTLSVSNNQLVVTSTGSGYCEFYVSISPLYEYWLVFDYVSNSGNSAFGVYASATGYISDPDGGLVSSSYTATRSYGTYSIRIPAGNGLCGIVMDPNAAGETWTFDNISVRRIIDNDRSINNAGLQAYGTITRTAVATGSNLVSYGNFSTTRYLEYPYRSSLNFGTGDFSIIWWMNSPSITVDQSIFQQGDYNATGGLFALVLNSGGNGDSINIGIRGVFNFNLLNHESKGWTQVAFTRESGLVKLYQNGELKHSTSDSTNIDMSAKTIKSFIIGAGIHNGVPNYAYGGELALFRISSTAPSAEQIKLMYNDEKQLFEPNSQSTLYGSSDVVRALAYDETTKLLHAGNSEGISTFSGLRRVSNTTTGVTTAISASNSLIADQ